MASSRPSGGSFWSTGREQGEADQRFRIDRAVRADAQRRIRLAAADRLDAELDGGCPRGAGGRERIGEPLVPKRSAIRSATVPNMNARAIRGSGRCRRPSEVVIGDAAPLRRRLRRRLRAAAIPSRPAATAMNSAPGKSPLPARAGPVPPLPLPRPREALRQHRRAEGARPRPCRPCRPCVVRKPAIGKRAMRWMPERPRPSRPRYRPALAERGDDTHAGHGDEGTPGWSRWGLVMSASRFACAIVSSAAFRMGGALAGQVPLPRRDAGLSAPAASWRAHHEAEALAAAMADAGHGGILDRPGEEAAAARAMPAGNCASIVWPNMLVGGGDRRTRSERR